MFTQKYNSRKQIGPFEINFYFACIGLPIMTFLIWRKGDYQQLLEIFITYKTPNVGLQSFLFFSGIGGFLITMNILLVVTLCGPIYINIAGTSKDVVLSFLGVAIFQDQELSLKFFVGLALSFLGVSYFTYAKMINIQ